MRLHAQMNQKVCGWTGYNILIRNEIQVRQDNIGYLLTTDAPATSITTVNEILVRSLKIKEVLELKSIVLVFDQISNPLRHGWTQDENKLGIDWMSGQPAPTAVLELLSCSCTRSCKLPNCSCLLNGMNCTDLCRLPECENRREEAVVVDVDAADYDTDED